MLIAVASTKGGSGKTTTAMHIAAGLSQNAPTIVIDADPQESAISWASGETVELPFLVNKTSNLSRDIARLHENYQHIIVDCPPGNLNIIAKAIRSVEHVILTAQPTPADLDRLLEVDDMVLEEQDDDDLPTLHVLLTRVIKRTNAQTEARQIIENNTINLFDAEIYNRQAIAMSHGVSIGTDLHGYEDVVSEMMQIHKETVR